MSAGGKQQEMESKRGRVSSRAADRRRRRSRTCSKSDGQLQEFMKNNERMWQKQSVD